MILDKILGTHFIDSERLVVPQGYLIQNKTSITKCKKVDSPFRVVDGVVKIIINRSSPAQFTYCFKLPVYWHVNMNN